jgi:hypothetical protein
MNVCASVRVCESLSVAMFKLPHISEFQPFWLREPFFTHIRGALMMAFIFRKHGKIRIERRDVAAAAHSTEKYVKYLT